MTGTAVRDAFLVGVMLGLAAGLWLVLSIDRAPSRDLTGKWAQNPLKPWFDSLQSPKGVYCCSEADGVETEYDIRGNHYWAPIDGEWREVPDDAVITEPNKVGRAMKWLIQSYDPETQMTKKFFRCFLPAGGV